VIAAIMMIATDHNADPRFGFPLVHVGTKPISRRFLPDSDWS
jgi:hypothetical protein